MAYLLLPPLAKRAARVLSLERSTDTGGTREADVPGGDLYDTETHSFPPAGSPPWCAVTRTWRAGSPSGWAGTPRAGPGRCCWAGSRWTNSPRQRPDRRPRPGQGPGALSGTLRDLLDVPSSGAVPPADALAAAQCQDVLDALVQGSLDAADPMDARISERGRSLSGGQRQRLPLARSLITDPEVLVLDEPTSAVDSHTEARIADGLRRLRSGRTTVVFTSSPLLLDRADRVALVHEGEVVAVGVHRELVDIEPRYRAVVTRETDEELAAADEGVLLDALQKLEEIEESA